MFLPSFVWRVWNQKEKKCIFKENIFLIRDNNNSSNVYETSDVKMFWLPVRPRLLVLPSAWRRTPDAPGQSAARRWHQTGGSSPSSGAPASSLFLCCKTATYFPSGPMFGLWKIQDICCQEKKKKKTGGALGIQHSGALTEVSWRLPPQITEGINKICYATQAGINFF